MISVLGTKAKIKRESSVFLLKKQIHQKANHRVECLNTEFPMELTRLSDVETKNMSIFLNFILERLVMFSFLHLFLDHCHCIRWGIRFLILAASKECFLSLFTILRGITLNFFMFYQFDSPPVCNQPCNSIYNF